MRKTLSMVLMFIFIFVAILPVYGATRSVTTSPSSTKPSSTGFKSYNTVKRSGGTITTTKSTDPKTYTTKSQTSGDVKKITTTSKPATTPPPTTAPSTTKPSTNTTIHNTTVYNNGRGYYGNPNADWYMFWMLWHHDDQPVYVTGQPAPAMASGYSTPSTFSWLNLLIWLGVISLIIFIIYKICKKRGMF